MPNTFLLIPQETVERVEALAARVREKMVAESALPPEVSAIEATLQASLEAMTSAPSDQEALGYEGPQRPAGS